MNTKIRHKLLTFSLLVTLQFGCRPWNLSLVCVIVLGSSNMLLTFLLLQSETCIGPVKIFSSLKQSSSSSSASASQSLQAVAVAANGNNPCPTSNSDGPPAATAGIVADTMDDDSASSVLQFDVRLGLWDSRRLYRSWDAVLVGTRYVELSASHRVCLATQSSLEKLHSLVQVAHQWQGPLSLGLFVAGDEEFEAAQRYLDFLQRCYAAVRERVTVSVLVPGSRAPRQQPRYYPLPDFLDCERPEAALRQFARPISAEQASWRVRNAYPQNHMRNLARKNCQAEWVFLTDVDVVPSSNLSQLLEDFLRDERNRCDKCAYVIPTFELDARVRFPQNKSELVRLAKKSLARPFHHKVFIHNQFATNFTRWMMDSQPGQAPPPPAERGDTRARVSHDVTNFEFLYEPFYVARDVAPAHDERFMGYGYTRNTQVYEMYVAGYKFKVLTPTFTVHWGLQTRKSRPAWRERQNSVNRKHFEIFKKEVFARYSRDPLKMVKNGPRRRR
uniref:Beta-1,4-glucuronyltransferase 1 n=1 Tax=Trichogramma kaykai TaxID=54128 RepID=A0ABD2VZG3_9HYME